MTDKIQQLLLIYIVKETFYIGFYHVMNRLVFDCLVQCAQRIMTVS